ncbi:MAG TPA: acetolactate synthase small subunit [Bacteroidales bacterium]
MEQEYTITAFSENSIGLLNRITIIFTRRQVNIESLTVSQSSLPGIHKFTIVINATLEKVEKVTKQIEKLVEVLKAFYHTNEEIIQQEIALYKVPTEALMGSQEIENLVRNSGARILEITPDYTVIEKTGYKSETQELFQKLDKYGVSQFTRSGTVAVTKSPKELLTEYLQEMDRVN